MIFVTVAGHCCLNPCMRNNILSLSAALLLVPVVTVMAQSTTSSTDRDYDTSHLGRYTDTAGWDLPTKVAVSVLTDAGIVEGDPSGTYRANSTLNRAEFIKIIMGLLPPPDGRSYLNCFPDVAPGVWYEASVCRAKSLGIVRGNVDLNVAPGDWRFEPNRPVQYEEAVKVLVKLYAYSAVETNGDNWYVPFINEALDRDLDLNGVVVGDKITRGEMARLTANFLAYSEGDLDLLQAAQSNSSSSSSRSSSSSSRTSSSSSSSSRTSPTSSSSMSSSSRSGTYDPLTDTTVQSNIVLLGQTSPILASAKFYSNNEPMNVDSLTITLASSSPSVDAFLVYDQDGYLLGTASQMSGSSNVYRVTFPTGRLTLPRRMDHSVYIRARLKQNDSGGMSGDPLQIATINITGTGEWSNDAYSSTSSESFPAFAIARAAITSITNAGASNTLLTGGTDQLLATFAVNTTATDSQAHVILQQIRMQIQATGGVTLSNVKLRQEGNDTVVNCTIASNVVTCGSIPATFGTITGTENFRVYGDITVPSNANNPSLSLTINEPGTPTTAGDITWSDGTSTFTWIKGSAPVVRGTQFQ